MLGKVLVTGGTGLVGNNVVRLLSERSTPTRILVRATSDPRPLAGLDVEVAYGDVRDATAVATALEGVEFVIHAAAEVRIGWTGLAAAQAINVDGTQVVAQAARAAGVRMVHVSSVDALGMAPDGAPSDEDIPAAGGVLCPYVVTKARPNRSCSPSWTMGYRRRSSIRAI